nr:60S ribosomal protein L26-1-like [Ipomoea trifida]
MKYNPHVSSSHWKCQKAYFTTPSSVRRVLINAPFKWKLNVRCTCSKDLTGALISTLHMLDDGAEKVQGPQWEDHPGVHTVRNGSSTSSGLPEQSYEVFKGLSSTHNNHISFQMVQKNNEVVVTKLKLDVPAQGPQGRVASKDKGKVTVNDVVAAAETLSIDQI